MEFDYNLEVKANYKFSDGIIVNAFNAKDADLKHDKLTKEKEEKNENSNV